MGKFDALAASAAALIRDKGSAVTFTSTVPGEFDPVSQETTGGSTRSTTMVAVESSPGRSAERVLGSLVGRNVLVLTCAPTGQPLPAPGDAARWSGSDWAVRWVDPINPAGDGPITFTCYIER